MSAWRACDEVRAGKQKVSRVFNTLKANVNTIELTFFVFLGSLAAGFLGSLTGLGGGVVIVPLLTLAFHVDIRYAIGASLVSVIATSSGAAAAYVREGYSNIRVGMFLKSPPPSARSPARLSRFTCRCA